MTSAAATPSTAPTEEILFQGHPALIPSVGALLFAIVTLGAALLYFLVRSRGVTYKVTTRRVLVERGLLSKRLEQIDTYRIKDYVVERPIGQRLLGTGNLLLLTMDATSPNVELRGLATDVLALYERLRAAAEAERVRRGVRIIEDDR
jgi:uncharacterized membrane protein YdbT with pleckstrin-like domain